MNPQELIEVARKSNELALIIFYADWSPHYEWIERAMAQEDPNVHVIRINSHGDEKIAKQFDIEIVPAFVLFKGNTILWKQTGDVTPDELKEIITMFNI